MNQTARHEQVMANLSSRLDSMLTLLGGANVHYVDVPVYDNVGDQLILLGALKLLDEGNCRVIRRAAWYNFDTAWVRPGDVVVFQGGGNLGDIYPWSQGFRERVIPRLKNNRVVIFPQTIKFQDANNEKRCAALFSQHPDLHLFVRDERSLKIAECMTTNVALMPDTAHRLWQPGTVHHGGDGTLGFFRVDEEASGWRPEGVFKTCTDWAAVTEPVRARMRSDNRAMVYAHRLNLDRMLGNWLMGRWLQTCEQTVLLAKSLFSSHAQIQTDRLHGHILSTLLAIPHVLFDNSYGKNHAYAGLWTSESPLVKLERFHENRSAK